MVDSAAQALSKVLFGQTHRLDMLIIASHAHGLVNLTDMATRLGVTVSGLQAPLRDLVNADILRPATLREMVAAGLDVDDVRQRKFYVRNEDSLVWPWVEQLRAKIDAVEIESEVG